MRTPNFFIAGAPKCGSTTLWGLLRQHPDVFLRDPKEPNHYNVDLRLAYGTMPFRDRDRYLALFADCEERLVGDSSVWYLSSTEAPARIHQDCPDARVLVVLRPPADAIRSMYEFSFRLGGESATSLARALELEPARHRREQVPSGVQLIESLRYRWAVRYADQLSRWFETFGRDSVRVFLLEEIAADPLKVARESYAFLGIDETFVPTARTKNTTRSIRDKPLAHFLRRRRRLRRWIGRLGTPALRHEVEKRLGQLLGRQAPSPIVRPETLERLRRELRPEVESLGRLLDRDLTHWDVSVQDPSDGPGGRSGAHGTSR